MTSSKFAPKHISGEWIISQNTVCNSGKIEFVSVEKYDLENVKGYIFIIHRPDGNYGNRKLYSTAQKAINAAARVVID